jgi:hypothetical protein
MANPTVAARRTRPPTRAGLLVLGTDFPYTNFPPQQRTAQVDADASHLGRRTPLEVAVHVTDPNALSIPPAITGEQIRGFATTATKMVLGGGVGKMVDLARAKLRNVPRP